MNRPRIRNFTNADVRNRREPSDSNHGQVDAVSRDRQRQQQVSVPLPYIAKIETISYDHNSNDIHLTTGLPWTR